MKFKKIFAAAAACAVATLSAVAMTVSTVVSAVETEIAYTGPSADALAMNDDGSTLRFNIYNEWVQAPMTAIKDINNKGSFEESINVTFTVSGLNGSTNKNEDGSDGDAYKAELVGSIGSDNYWGSSDPSKNTVTNDPVALTGNGQYTASFKLSSPADTVLCLILTTNINAYNYAESGKPADTGITFKIDKITTGGATAGGNNTTPTQAPSENNNQPTQANNGNNQTTQAQNNNTSGGTSGGAVLGNSTQTTSASTGDAGVAAAVAGLVITTGIGITAVALRRKK